MTISNIIVHHLIRSPDADSATIHPRSTPLPVTPITEGLLQDLLQSYNQKSDKAHGCFSAATEGETQLQDWLSAYLNDSAEFVNFSLKTTESLKEKLDTAGMFFGGFVLIAHYCSGLTQYLLIALVTPASSVSVTEQLDIIDTVYLDMGRLNLAARINITEWQSNSQAQRYISWIKPRGGRRLSDCFKGFLGGTETANTKKDTDTLINAVEAYSGGNNEALAAPDRVKKRVYEYCNEQLQSNEAISLNELSTFLNEAEPDNFTRFINTQDYDLAPKITPSKSQLKRLIRYSGRAKGLNIAFDADLLGNRILYNQENDTLTIHGIPDNIKSQLEKA
ncbi:MAG: nucleoid-associated protein YejK [Endozoicomonadaceae bacterium]|nr:nucleoid-associated protein YejK [Endozoicomonadaceae bacterium]